MSPLERALQELTIHLGGANDVIVRTPAIGPDQLMVWDWSRRTLSRRFPDLQVSALHLEGPQGRTVGAHLAPGSACYRLRRGGRAGGAATNQERLLDLPGPSDDDLIAILYERRGEMTLHHGLLITRGAQRRAFEHAVASGGARNARLCSAFDLLDEAILAYRQSLLALARTPDETRRIARAFANIALAIERVQQADARIATGGNGHAAKAHGLLRAVRDFQSVVGSLAGPARAAIVAREAVDRYAAFAV
jgi:hypothetical protein